MKFIKLISVVVALLVTSACSLPRVDISYGDSSDKPLGQSKRFIEQDEPTISIKPIPTEKLSGVDAGGKVGSLSITPIAEPKAAAPTSTWTLTAGNTIREELQTWGAKAGWTVLWELDKDWVVPANTTFTGDYQTAADSVLNTVAANGALIRATFYTGNKTLLVFGPGRNTP